jgi:hypothetical protein
LEKKVEPLHVDFWIRIEEDELKMMISVRKTENERAHVCCCVREGKRREMEMKVTHCCCLACL